MHVCCCTQKHSLNSSFNVREKAEQTQPKNAYLQQKCSKCIQPQYFLQCKSLLKVLVLLGNYVISHGTTANI